VGLSTSPIAPRPDIPGFGGHTEDEVPSVLASVWRDIRTAKGKERFFGMSIFEFQDEWWKSAKGPEAAMHQDAEDPEQWFGVYGVDIKGTLTPKGDIPESIGRLFATP
jgi:hypothetical protein